MSVGSLCLLPHNPKLCRTELWERVYRLWKDGAVLALIDFVDEEIGFERVFHRKRKDDTP